MTSGTGGFSFIFSLNMIRKRTNFGPAGGTLISDEPLPVDEREHVLWLAEGYGWQKEILCGYDVQLLRPAYLFVKMKMYCKYACNKI